MVFDRVGRIDLEAPDPWKDQTSRMSSGVHNYTQLTVKAYPHTMVWVPIGCACFLGV